MTPESKCQIYQKGLCLFINNFQEICIENVAPEGLSNFPETSFWCWAPLYPLEEASWHLALPFAFASNSPSYVSLSADNQTVK